MTVYSDITRRSRQRCLTAAALRYDGLSFREIGERMGNVTVETARQSALKGERILAHQYQCLNWCAQHVHLIQS